MNPARCAGLWACLVALLGAPAAFCADVVYGLDNASQSQWNGWFENLERDRKAALEAAGVDGAIYADASAAWSDLGHHQYFLFMYDSAFFSGGQYHTSELLADLRRRFGAVDSVLLWHSYPRLGFDRRSQFDYYAQMPGGLEGLRKQVVDVLHEEGVRVFIDFNPWDADPSFERLADTVVSLDADGVMLDTMDDVPARMREAVSRRKPGVVFVPESRPSDAQLGFARQSWAQWYDLGDFDQPSIYREKWLEQKHMQFAIRRWDTDRGWEILYSFFNGSGVLLWDNVFGSWNPYSPSDRNLLAETGILLEAYAPFFSRGKWSPLVPTGVSGLDANKWELDGKTVYLLRNRSERALSFRLPPGREGLAYTSFWTMPHDGAVVVEPGSVEAVVLDDETHALRTLARFLVARARATQDEPGYDERAPAPRRLKAPESTTLAKQVPSTMTLIPGGSFTMTVSHQKRESGCYSFGAGPEALWGEPHTQTITHRIPVELKRFALRKTAVTNAEFVRFVRESGYRPKDSTGFLKHLRMANGELFVSAEASALPVTYVSLEDARAYARWKGERLPWEAEWQWVAEGAGRGNAWPWGNDEALARDPNVVNMTGELSAADAHPRGATPQGVFGLSGNAWELTEGEWSDGHTRFVILRGGVFLPRATSDWVIPRGARPNSFHAKYLLLSDGLDRSEAISFRTVVDIVDEY